jgi:peptidoglycan/LPS O-acetylase OafA/YrhL
MARPNILPLTSFRFIAAMAVVIFHYDKKLQLFPVGLADFGYEAVSFFFVLSGFILTYTHGRPGGLNLSLAQFARSRLIRIVPTYYLALIVAAPFLVASMIKAGHFVPENLLVPPMLHSWWPPAALLWNSPAWSLSNEIFFYALFPLIWALCRRVTPTTSLAAASAMVVAVSVFRTAFSNAGENWHNFSAYFPLLNLPQRHSLRRFRDDDPRPC